jgi:hypothetical protein
LSAGARINCAGDPNLFAVAQHCAFHHGIDVQFKRDLWQGLAHALYGITEVREITRNALICANS